MDLYKIIRELQEERKRLDQIVTSLEQLSLNSSGGAAEPESRRGRRSMDAGAREEVSKRMKRYWASRRAEDSGTSS